MPDPKFVDPPDGKAVRARGAVTPPDAPDVVASMAPDDDLDDLFPTPAPLPEPESIFKDGDKVLIHVLEDGFTANGQVWYRGQELEYTVGEESFKDTFDIRGNTWLSLSPADQMRRYGKIMFGVGVWPGNEYENPQALKAERERSRKPPAIGKLSPTVITRS